MRLINQSYEIWNQPASLEGIYKQIERVGRVCYKSEDKITEDSAKPFVDRMIKSGHGAMLEHGTIYLAIPMTTYAPEAVNIYRHNSYSKVNECNKFIFTDKYGDKVAAWCVTTNLRVLVENDCLEDLEFLCEPTEYHERRVTVHFVCDRGVSHEFVRHRVMSFAQESTRYCNYSKDKFGNELTFIIPSWCSNRDEVHIVPDKYDVDWNNKLIEDFGNEQGRLYIGLALAENTYLDLLKIGWTPQQARAVLPNSLKTELVMTGFVSDWKHFFRIRSRIAETGKPHPQAQELADPLMNEFIKRGIMETLI